LTPDRTDGTPTAIERELAAALDVAPSPDFVARVRMRVTNEPTPRRAWTTWMPMAVGATALAAAVMIAVIAPWRGSQVRLKPDPTTDVRLKPDTTTDITTQVRLKPNPARDTHSYVVSAFRRTDEPEVLVPQADVEMYRRLIASARVNAVVVDLPTDVVAELQPPSELIIDPIKIEPIPPPSGEGERR
jgi:hypothetical protein